MASTETVEYVSGLDLGQANEFTALAVLERRTPPRIIRVNDPFPRSRYGTWSGSRSARRMGRFSIGVSTLFSSKPLLATPWSRTRQRLVTRVSVR